MVITSLRGEGGVTGWVIAHYAMYTLKYSMYGWVGGWVGGAKFVVFNPHASSIAVAVKHCKALKQCIKHSHELKEKKKLSKPQNCFEHF